MIWHRSHHPLRHVPIHNLKDNSIVDLALPPINSATAQRGFDFWPGLVVELPYHFRRGVAGRGVVIAALMRRLLLLLLRLLLDRRRVLPLLLRLLLDGRRVLPLLLLLHFVHEYRVLVLLLGEDVVMRHSGRWWSKVCARGGVQITLRRTLRTQVVRRQAVVFLWRRRHAQSWL